MKGAMLYAPEAMLPIIIIHIATKRGAPGQVDWSQGKTPYIRVASSLVASGPQATHCKGLNLTAVK